MRLQLAINVSNLQQAIDFYSKMFGHEPAKVKPGYANFAIDNPPLKLVLFEGAGEAGSINHLGVETVDAQEVETAHKRLQSHGLVASDVVDTECCYAAKTETWVTAPDQLQWEWYVKNGDSDTLNNTIVTKDAAEQPARCC